MATILLGCDRNGNDESTRDTVAKILRKAGHTVEVLGVGPGNLQPEMMKSSSKGKISVYLQANSLETYADWEDGLKPGGYYHVKYAYFGLRGDIAEYESCREPGFHTMKLTHDNDRNDGYEQRYAGKTPAEISELCKKYYTIVPGASATEIGNNLVKAIDGESLGSDSSSSKSTSSSGTSIKEALKKAVSKWDGDVEIRLENDTVYVNKIKDPTTAKLTLTEYTNIIYDSLTVNDVNPDTINHLTSKFDDYALEYSDKTLIKRFGEVSKKIKIPKSVKKLEEAEEYFNREWNKIRRDDGRSVECKVQGNTHWKTGKWVRVYIPSFYIDDYMYIIKCSHDEDGTGNWTTSLTLVDYPPSFGTFKDEEESS